MTGFRYIKFVYGAALLLIISAEQVGMFQFEDVVLGFLFIIALSTSVKDLGDD